MLTDNEMNRYLRHFSVKDWTPDDQDKLKNAKVFVAGAGGLGSPLLYYIAAAGIGEITICDNDMVDLSNLNRQILYDNKSIGREKALEAAERLSLLNSSICLKHISNEISENMSEDLKSYDLLIDCLDNFRARHILNKVSADTGIPLIHAGVSEYYGQLTFIRPGETACLACFAPQTDIHGSTGIIGAAAGTIGSLQALEAVKYITGKGELLKNRILFFDGLSMDFSTLTISRNPECKICSHLYGGPK